VKGLDLSGTVDVPVVGTVPKKALVGIGAAAAAFVAWRWWAARGGSGDGEAATVEDGEFGAVDKQVPTGYATQVGGRSEDAGGGSGTSDPSLGRPTTNDEWSRRAVDYLSQASDRWSIAEITTAIGNYLGSRPLSSTSQDIVRSAIAVQGYPPVGTFSIVQGGDATLSLAPTGLRVSNVTGTTVTISFTPVAGAAYYRAYRGVGGSVADSTGSPIVVRGLEPGTSYTFTIQPVTAGGKTGPSSAAVSAKTSAVKLAAPGTPTQVALGRVSATFKTNPVAGADSYVWRRDGVIVQTGRGLQVVMPNLTPNKTYRVTVQAQADGVGGPGSPARTFKTKK
jgi:hypothetical protein